MTECGLLMSIGNIDLSRTNIFFQNCVNSRHSEALTMSVTSQPFPIMLPSTADMSTPDLQEPGKAR